MGDSSPSEKKLESVAPGPMGKYAPFARLGDGGMADVFLAVARGMQGFNKLAVIKRLRNPEDASLVRMFFDEARLSARLGHPNIVHTYDVGDANGKLYIAMEYLEGQSLHALLAALAESATGLSEALAAWIATQMLKGLHYAHELTDYDGTPLGIVHRDVSPHNLLVTYGGEVKVLDFGIAKAKVNATHTETGVLKGKIRYMAPEQAGEKNVDRRVDVFAAGIVLWEMIARRRLYDGDSISVLNKIAGTDAPLLRSVRPETAPELEAIAAKALARDPDARYATAEQMRVDLERFLVARQGVAQDAALAEKMNELFATTRDAARARIKSFLEKVPSEGATSLSSIDQPTDLPPLFGEGSGPKRGPPSASASGVEQTRVEVARSRASSTPWAIVLGVVAIAAIAFAALRSRPDAPPAPAPAASTPAPSIPAAATSVPPAETTRATIDATVDAAASASASTAPPPSAAPSIAPPPKRAPRVARPAPSAQPSATARPKIRALDDDDNP